MRPKGTSPSALAFEIAIPEARSIPLSDAGGRDSIANVKIRPARKATDYPFYRTKISIISTDELPLFRKPCRVPASR